MLWQSSLVDSALDLDADRALEMLITPGMAWDARPSSLVDPALDLDADRALEMLIVIGRDGCVRWSIPRSISTRIAPSRC